MGCSSLFHRPVVFLGLFMVYVFIEGERLSQTGRLAKKHLRIQNARQDDAAGAGVKAGCPLAVVFAARAGHIGCPLFSAALVPLAESTCCVELRLWHLTACLVSHAGH